MSAASSLPVLVAGGGIGGLAAALALVRQGHRVKVLEQAPELGEIGAGIQLGPNAFHAFDALGIGPQARARAVYTDEMVMHDAIDEYLVGKSPPARPFGPVSAIPTRSSTAPTCTCRCWRPPRPPGACAA